MSTISHIDHIAIAVNSISQVRSFYEDALGLKITEIEEMPERGIKTAFITVGQTKIELIEPMNDKSEISKFLKNRGPGIHHMALKTLDITKCEQNIRQEDVKLIYDTSQKGAHNTKINFVHPKSSGGVLVEIVE